MYKGNAREYVQDVAVDPRPLIEGIAHGLHYLHCHQPFPIVHGNMKGTNVLISGDGQPLLTDFGSLNLVCSSFTTSTPCFGAVGTLRWNAPEILEIPEASTTADIWAFGMTVLELFTRRDPYYKLDSMASIIRQIVQRPPERPSPRDTLSRMTDKWWNMCLTCWQCNPKLRPSMSYFVENIPKVVCLLSLNHIPYIVSWVKCTAEIQCTLYH
ncbi:hypothetical protein ID866_12738 [Astraeus odoratus]|nr:hypothetical protein ID866_12738 [Astraeus odoratus]